MAPNLAAGEPAGTLDVEPEMLDAAALALGDLSRAEPPTVLNRRSPACVVVAVAQVTARYDKNGKVSACLVPGDPDARGQSIRG